MWLAKICLNLKSFVIHSLLILFCFEMTALGHYLDNDIQAPIPIEVDEKFKAVFPPIRVIAEVPLNCRNVALHRVFPCQADSKLELKLEREYWSYINLVDSDAMNQWLKKTRLYVRLSKTRNAGRLAMLRIFANLHVYSDSPLIIDPLRSPYVLGAMAAASDALDHMPRSPNAYAFFWAMQNFTQFALGLSQEGVESAKEMMELGETFGKWGAAGPVGAVAHLMGSSDPELVRWGVEYYDKCFSDGVCQYETSIAPFQYIGTLVTQAEAYGYLGETKKMHETLDKVAKLSTTRDWPFAADVEEIRHDLTKQGGLIDKWSAGNAVGVIRSPRGVSHSRKACAYCHAGNYVPDHYYPIEN